MAKITLVDDTNSGVPAVIFQNGTGIGAADVNGVIDLPNGTYTAKIIGFEDKTFDVNGDAFVLMKMKDLPSYQAVEVKGKSTAWKKWVKLGAIGLVLFGIVKLLTRK